jgi:hypothetical protein
MTPFLIFAPTYRHLEQLYESLACVNGKETSVAVLHSAVDIEDCVRILNQHKTSSPQKAILLASAIADSSITIPGVGVVIDLCRSLQVKMERTTTATRTQMRLGIPSRTRTTQGTDRTDLSRKSVSTHHQTILRHTYANV